MTYKVSSGTLSLYSLIHSLTHAFDAAVVTLYRGNAVVVGERDAGKDGSHVLCLDSTLRQLPQSRGESP